MVVVVGVYVNVKQRQRERGAARGEEQRSVVVLSYVHSTVMRDYNYME